MTYFYSFVKKVNHALIIAISYNQKSMQIIYVKIINPEHRMFVS